LSLRNNRIREKEHSIFWEELKKNQTLKIVDLFRTGTNDSIIDSMDGFLSNKASKLREINLSHNGITDEGA
jgi:hypothetical protein